MFLELLTPAEMGEADRLAPGLGMSGTALMAAAGRAVARVAMARFRPCRTLVLAGTGNNGGDGYVAARLLEQAGWPVSVMTLGAPRENSDAAAAAARWRGPVLQPDPAEVARHGLVIDAIFGAGLSRPVEGMAEALLRACAQPILAVDVPSGLDGATGAVRGYAPQAAVTVTFFRRKPGHWLMPGRQLCGETVLADIGMPEAVLESVRPRCFENRPGLWELPRLALDTHKYKRGHLSVVGSQGMTGAGRMVSEAARRTGAGLVTVLAPDAASAATYRNDAPGTIVVEGDLATQLQDERLETWVIGPGLPPAPATRDMLRQLIDAKRLVLADAGAITACAGDPDALRGAAVLTPHAGEFARAFGPIGENKLAVARAAAARTGAVVVLKGADTVIAAPGGRCAINANAPPTLGTAGTGDVLSGIIAGLLAQKLPPFDAAAAGVWLHGEAARNGPRLGLVAEDVIAAVPAALRAGAAASRAD